MSATDKASGRRAGHENRDIHVRSIMVLGLVLLLGTVASMFFVDWMFDALNESENVSQPALPSELPAATPADQQAPVNGQPSFVMYPAKNLSEFRQAEEKFLASYGWVDREAGVARIPVERAMDLLIRDGLPPVPPRPPAGENAP